MSKAKRDRPHWEAPSGAARKTLHLYNSLTRSKEPFVPLSGNRVQWYGCGPTVYDEAHMGHARAYVSFDIVRRVLRDYFKYNVEYCMNITDIDDKIIKRARQHYLLQLYMEKSPALAQVISDTETALANFREKDAKETDKDKKTLYAKITAAVADQLKIAAAAEGDEAKARDRLLYVTGDIVAEWLDKSQGCSVNDPAVFQALPRKFERLFFKDMADLNIEDPDVLTRVSEFVPPIVKFVEKIIENEFAYESNGSVYFDVTRFELTDKHYYAKLVPEAAGDLAALAEGEGDLSCGAEKQSEKRHENDFALWKASKPGEPAWDSPWGQGRPGWHIECSAMAAAVFGSTLDIHSGGVDLKFPHHDNEIAQTEAHFKSSQWVNYFLHAGHLTIDGCKMSKSLKNFITIQQALKKHSARQIRLGFLLHSWKDTLDYSDNTMADARQFERYCSEFLLTVKSAALRQPEGADLPFWGEADLSMQNSLAECREQVHTALCDSIDTRAALEAVQQLIGVSNSYMNAAGDGVNISLMRQIAGYIAGLFKMLGLICGDSEFAFVETETSDGAGSLEKKLVPYLETMAKFRDDIRDRAGKSKDAEVLRCCDELRDLVLPDLGVRLEDKAGGAVIKLVPREMIMRERAEAAAREEEKRKKKEEMEVERRKKEEAKKVPPAEQFADSPEYSKWDEQGLPTHDAAGEPLAKSTLKKVKKLYDAQSKKYNEFLASKAS